MSYQFLCSEQTQQELASYHHALIEDRSIAGAHLTQALSDVSDATLSAMSAETFLERLLNTKPPQIFAEMSIEGDGSDWTLTELRLLGDVSCAVPCLIFDDGEHTRPTTHLEPFEGHLLFVPGPLLRHGSGDHRQACDYAQVVALGDTPRLDQIDQARYSELIIKRLLPSLRWANERARSLQQQALITIPGIGCGQFAGPFAGQLEPFLEEALAELLRREGDNLTAIKALYFGTYRALSPRTQRVNGVPLITQPLLQGGRPQLCEPNDYSTPELSFEGCALFSVVAWDHVSWPGNDIYLGSRATDDGVKGAATSAVGELTGVQGVYDHRAHQYRPPAPYRNWREVVLQQGLRLKVSSSTEA